MRPITLEGRLLPIFPCRNRRPTCPGGFKAATTDPVAIAVLWQNYSGSGCQVGVATGSVSGIDILDIDPRHGGDRWFHQHRAEIPTTRTHETPGGGWHLVFQHSPGLRCTNSVVARGVDVKADGGYVVWHPKSGLRVLCEGPVAEWPEWILEAARENLHNGGGCIREGQCPNDPDPNRTHPPPTRNLSRRVERILLIVETAQPGTRNKALFWSACQLRDIVLSEHRLEPKVAVQLLISAAMLCGLVRDKGINSVRNTIASAWRRP